MDKPPVAQSNARQLLAERKKRDAIDQLYHQEPWPSLSGIMRKLNPVCQRILNAGLYRNEQCHNASTMTHHKISPRDTARGGRALFYTPSNLICLCDTCHTDAEGTPEWQEGIDYVSTVLPKWSVV